MKILIRIGLNSKSEERISENIMNNIKISPSSNVSNENKNLPEKPVDDYLADVMELYRWCQDDKDALTNAGIEWNIVKTIPALAYTLRNAESRWLSEKFKTSNLSDKWKKAARHGYKLRNIILHAMEYAFRYNPDLMAEISLLKNGNGSDNLSQNLKEISAFGKKHSAMLSHINYDVHLLDEAADLAEILQSILASTENDEKAINVKRERDEAYLTLKEAVDEIRAYGQNTFEKNSERLYGYLNFYNDNHKSQYYYKFKKEH